MFREGYKISGAPIYIDDGSVDAKNIYKNCVVVSKNSTLKFNKGTDGRPYCTMKDACQIDDNLLITDINYFAGFGRGVAEARVAYLVNNDNKTSVLELYGLINTSGDVVTFVSEDEKDLFLNVSRSIFDSPKNFFDLTSFEVDSEQSAKFLLGVAQHSLQFKLDALKRKKVKGGLFGIKMSESTYNEKLNELTDLTIRLKSQYHQYNPPR